MWTVQFSFLKTVSGPSDSFPHTANEPFGVSLKKKSIKSQFPNIQKSHCFSLLGTRFLVNLSEASTDKHHV
jgi:hypothetical protein